MKIGCIVFLKTPYEEPKKLPFILIFHDLLRSGWGGYDFTENEFSLQLSPSKEKRGLWL